MIFNYPEVTEHTSSESSESSAPTPSEQPAGSTTNSSPTQNANGEAVDIALELTAAPPVAPNPAVTDADTANNDTTTEDAPARPELLPPGAIPGNRDHTWRMPDDTRIEIVRMLLIGWKPKEIAPRLNLSVNSVYNIKKNLMTYGTSIKPKEKESGRPPKVTPEDENALLQWLVKDGWKEQNDMKDWLLEERGISVERSTLSRLLRKKGWSETTIKRLGGRGLEVKRERKRRGPGKKTLMRQGLLTEEGTPVVAAGIQAEQQTRVSVPSSVPGVGGNALRMPPIDPQLGISMPPSQQQSWAYGTAHR